MQTVIASPVGPLLLKTDAENLREVSFTKKKITPLTDSFLKKCATEIAEYFNGTRTAFTVPMQAGGTPFQKAVWAAMATIPFGETASYAAIAKRIGNAKAVRAVGTACKKNPLAIVIPCHRVTASHGIGGYNGGLERKKKLLALEQKL